MDTQALLEQVLQSGKEMLGRGQMIAEDKLNIPEQGEERDAMLSGMGKGALIAGGLAALLGTKSGRRLTGSGLKLGGLAALGGLAYKTYQQWQQDNQSPGQLPDNGKTVLDATFIGQRSRLLVRAMIAAAKADGEIDEQEQSSINREIEKLGLDRTSAEFIAMEMEKPLNPDEIAAEIDSPETASEVYLVSRAIIDQDNALERNYLDELLKALDLPDELATELDKNLGA